MNSEFIQPLSKEAQKFWNKLKKNNKPVEINENDIKYFKKLKKTIKSKEQL